MQMPVDLPPEARHRLFIVGTVIVGLFLSGIAAGVAFLVRQSREDSLSWRKRTAFLVRLPLSATPVVGIIAGLILLHVLLGLAGLMTGGIVSRERAFFLQSLTFHWFVILFVLAWKCRQHWSWSDIFGFRLRGLAGNMGKGVVAYLIAMPIIFLSGYLYQVVLIRLGYEPAQQPIMNFLAGDISLFARIYGIVLAVIVAPVAEEILFRGLLLPVISRRLGVFPGIVLVGFVFAALHLFIPAIVPLFFVSLACSFAYIYTGSLSTPIAFHSLFNTVNLAFFVALYDIMA